MPLPKAIRRLTPDQIRHDPRVRAVALAAGVIPPRTMHSTAEAELLARLAGGARCVVEIGVYEGSSAIVLAGALGPAAALHLIDPFPRDSDAVLFPGWRGNATATRIAVWRHARGTGPDVRWHIARSQDVGREWDGPEVDLVFIDGDHAHDACRADWDLWHRHVRRGGFVAFHDARGSIGGPSAVVDELFRPAPPDGWRVTDEVDTIVVVQRL